MHAKVEEHLVVKIYRGINIAKWHIDAPCVAHDKFRLHTGGIFSTLESGSGLINSTVKKKHDSRGFTEED